jgi:hypothetical protein
VSWYRVRPLDCCEEHPVHIIAGVASRELIYCGLGALGNGPLIGWDCWAGLGVTRRAARRLLLKFAPALTQRRRKPRSEQFKAVGMDYQTEIEEK